MSSISWDEYNTAYKNAPAEVKAFIDEGKIAGCITTHFPDIDDKTKQTFVIGSANYLVGLQTKESLGELIKTMSNQTNPDALLTCLSSRSGAPHTERASAPTTQPTIRTMAADMAAARSEKPTASMAETTAEPVYTSTQAAILREGRNGEAIFTSQPTVPAQSTNPAQPTTPAKPAVAETDPDEARWGSAQ